MADTLRQQLVTALIARLKNAKVNGGYETNIGDNIFEWRDLEAEPWQDDEPDALVLRDLEEPATDGSIQPHTHDKELNIEIELRTGGTSTLSPPEQARKIIGDIEKAIGVDKFWNGKAKGTSPLSVNQMDVKKSGKAYAGARLKFSIRYRNKAFDPFNQ